MNRKMYLGFLNRSSRPFSSSSAAAASDYAAFAATSAAAIMPTAEAAAPNLRKLRREILFSFITWSSLFIQSNAAGLPQAPFFVFRERLYCSAPPPAEKPCRRKALVKPVRALPLQRKKPENDVKSCAGGALFPQTAPEGLKIGRISLYNKRVSAFLPLYRSRGMYFYGRD